MQRALNADRAATIHPNPARSLFWGLFCFSVLMLFVAWAGIGELVIPPTSGPGVRLAPRRPAAPPVRPVRLPRRAPRVPRRQRAARAADPEPPPMSRPPLRPRLGGLPGGRDRGGRPGPLLAETWAAMRSAGIPP